MCEIYYFAGKSVQKFPVTQHISSHVETNDQASGFIPLIPRERTYFKQYCQKCFSFRGVKLWNGLDAKPKLSKNLKQFESCLENSRT